ncbi:MAG TPA: DUF6179 domain-containing protein, partial [Syntrophomonas sp.]|nr:DUF6179 domain-containing protein [Syntrophomonas sp.]
MESNNYLAELSNQALRDGRLDEKDMLRIQNELWLLLAQQTESYTMGDSSSVPTETALELFKSICFSIGWYLQETGNDTGLMMGNMQDLLQASRALLQERIEEGKKLLRRVAASAPPVGSRSYRDTLAGLGEFFRCYDCRFFAHEIPGNIDYQLNQPVAETMGIAYVEEYLHRLLIENKFCRSFQTKTVISLLECSCPEYRELLVNIYEPVAVNAVGRLLLGKDVRGLDISTDEQARLTDYFRSLAQDEARKELRSAADRVCSELRITDSASCAYLRQTTLELYPRIKTAIAGGSLEEIFPSLRREPMEVAATTHYIDGETMDDKK